MSLPTIIRIVKAAVCQPLATSPPKNVAAAAASSRWKGCGSNWRCKRLDLSAVDRDDRAAFERLADGEVFQIQILGHVSCFQLHRACGFCFHSQMIQSTFFGSPPKSLSRVMHWPRWCCECMPSCTMASRDRDDTGRVRKPRNAHRRASSRRRPAAKSCKPVWRVLARASDRRRWTAARPWPPGRLAAKDRQKPC